MDIKLEEGERIIEEGPANHFKGWEAVGGRLYLTNLRLFFKSHRFNFQVHEESYWLKNIISVQVRDTLRIVPNGLAVTLQDGSEEKFVVYNREDWRREILFLSQKLREPA